MLCKSICDTWIDYTSKNPKWSHICCCSTSTHMVPHLCFFFWISSIWSGPLTSSQDSLIKTRYQIKPGLDVASHPFLFFVCSYSFITPHTFNNLTMVRTNNKACAAMAARGPTCFALADGLFSAVNRKQWCHFFSSWKHGIFCKIQTYG